MGYKGSTLAQTTVLNVTPNGNEGAFWGSGAGIAADGSGIIYLLDANGDFDTNLNSGGFPSDGDFGNGFLKISTSGGLAVADYFEMSSSRRTIPTRIWVPGAPLVSRRLSSHKTWQLAVGLARFKHLHRGSHLVGKFSTTTNNIYRIGRGPPGGLWSARILQRRLYFGR
jgi:hypothetical protein